MSRLSLAVAMADIPDRPRSKFAERAAREARLAKALRDNLRRRKEQARGQQQSPAPRSPGGSGRERDPPA
jgi:hypothetical protein